MQKIQVIHFPIAKINPYQQLMFNALRTYNIDPHSLTGGLLKLLKSTIIGKEKILHIHWISGPIIVNSIIGSLIRFIIFHSSLFFWRLRQKKIVWTVHNLVNHEKHHLWLDKLNSKLVANIAHQILVHGESIRFIVAEELKVSKNKIKVVYHGNYEGIVTSTSLNNKHRNGINFLFFGAVRPYKGVSNLIDNFIQLKGEHRLHIAGPVKASDLQQKVKNKAQIDKRISLSLQFIPNEELQQLLSWCDVVVLPYKEILTSGSLLMALSAARPIIVPRAGVIPEYINEKCGFIYEPNNPKGLVNALRDATKCNNLSNRANEALKCANIYSWNNIAGVLSQIYNTLACHKVK